MKKILVAFAAVGMAVSVYASACNWSAGIAAYDGKGAGDAPIEAGSYWLVALNGGSASDISVGPGGVLNIGKDMTNVYGDAIAVDDPFGIVGSIDGLSQADNDKMYAIVVWDNADKYGIGTGSISGIADAPPTDGEMLLKNGTSATFEDAPVVYLDQTIAAAPEPTSGLLLLLGMAGLALRRRRA